MLQPPAGISPVTRDFVNPEKPWPHLQRLAAVTAAAGKALMPRLAVYPPFLVHQQLLPASPRPLGPHPPAQRQQQQRSWLDAAAGRDSPLAAALRLADSEGLARGSSWFAGALEEAPPPGSKTLMHIGREQQTAAAPSNSREKPGVTNPAGQQQPLKSSMPAAQRPSAARSWRVGLAADGLLEGCQGPKQASAEVQRVLSGVLEHQQELGEGEIELLFTGKRTSCLPYTACMSLVIN